MSIQINLLAAVFLTFILSGPIKIKRYTLFAFLQFQKHDRVRVRLEKIQYNRNTRPNESH